MASPSPKLQARERRAGRTPIREMKTLDGPTLRTASKGLGKPRLPDALTGREALGAGALGRLAAKQTRDAEDGRGRRRLRAVVERATLGWTLGEQEAIEAMGMSAWLERQLDPESIDDLGLEDALEQAFPSIAMTPAQRLITYYEDEETPLVELELATLYRAAYSPRQLLERMVIFWTDHFNISLLSDFGIYLKPTDDRDVVRRHALGSFPELLRASAGSPAMLSYLTNDSNVVGHPNENYARELMELHTMGSDGGYTELDVKEVARCFTGWTWEYDDSPQDFGEFIFESELHDTGAKTVLGQTIPAGGGIEDGERVLDILAAHPSTARFVARKMLVYFWGYQPDDASVDRIAGIYLDTDGDIPSMVRGIFQGFKGSDPPPKLKRPFHLVVSAIRALFGELDNPYLLVESLYLAGHLPFTWGPPNGFPDSEAYWSGFVLPRFNFAGTFLAGDEPSVLLDLPFLDPAESPEVLAFILDILLLDQGMGDDTRAAVTEYLSGPRDAETLADAIGLVIAGPEFQRY